MDKYRTDEERVRWLEIKLLHAKATLEQIAGLSKGNVLANIQQGWSVNGHAAAEGLAQGWLVALDVGMPK